MGPNESLTLHANLRTPEFASLANGFGKTRATSKRSSQHLNLSTFMELIQIGFNNDVSDYPGLYQWSTENPGEFWASVWLYCDIRAYVTWRDVLSCPLDMLGARWFTGARLNFAENLLAYRDETEALVFCGANRQRTAISYAQLYGDVARLAAAFRRHGIKPGDRIAAIVANGPEAVVAMLAASSVGAVWASCRQQTEVDKIIACLGQISPRILIMSRQPEGQAAGLEWPAIRAEITARLPGLELVVTVGEPGGSGGVSSTPGEASYQEFVGETDATHVDFAPLPFDFPLYISFSETDSGKPNCVVHGAGGSLIQHLKELVLHVDMRRSDRVVSIASPGEMMWEYMVSTLTTGATLILYDPQGDDPDCGAVRRTVDEEQATMLGASTDHLLALFCDSGRHGAERGQASLRTLLAYGEKCPAELHDHANRCVAGGVRVSQMLARPDIHSCLALGNPMNDLRADELPTCALGLKLEILDTLGRPVRGRKGTLACTAPFPSMPIVVWQDFSGEKYLDAYFRCGSGYWSQGDCAEITASGDLIFHESRHAASAGLTHGDCLDWRSL